LRKSGIAACALATVKVASVADATRARLADRFAAVLEIESMTKLLIGAASVRLFSIVGAMKDRDPGRTSPSEVFGSCGFIMRGSLGKFLRQPFTSKSDLALAVPDQAHRIAPVPIFQTNPRRIVASQVVSLPIGSVSSNGSQVLRVGLRDHIGPAIDFHGLGLRRVQFRVQVSHGLPEFGQFECLLGDAIGQALYEIGHWENSFFENTIRAGETRN
jgi:hypothetical protein